MPLYEYECIKCRRAVEVSLEKLREEISDEIVSGLVNEYRNLNSIEVYDLDSKKKLAEYGKADNECIDMDFYLNSGSVMVLLNLRNYRFAELIYEEKDEERLKCPFCGEKKQLEKVVSSFSFTHDLSTDKPKPDLSGLPPDIRGRVQLGDYIEEKDRTKKTF